MYGGGGSYGGGGDSRYNDRSSSRGVRKMIATKSSYFDYSKLLLLLYNFLKCVRDMEVAVAATVEEVAAAGENVVAVPLVAMQCGTAPPHLKSHDDVSHLPRASAPLPSETAPRQAGCMCPIGRSSWTRSRPQR